ncbi:MAG: AEC family transporter [Candidatus Marinimicrobia bacterium]|nr:AEC family transporter [Candidatus Neomarinimicrobiota bacterium]
MTQTNLLIQSLLLLVSLIACTLWLKRRGIVTAENRVIFSRLVTDFVLPALIIETFARHTFKFQDLFPALIMLVVSIICLSLAWGVGRLFRLNKPKLGAFILVSGFGSSASLGYALVQQMMGSDPRAVNVALIIGEFGATMPFFIIGVAIAVYFGGTATSAKNKWAASISFFKSPIFLSLIFGIVLSFLHLPETNPVVAFFYHLLNIIGGSLIFIVAIAIGLMLRPIPMKSLLPLILAVAMIKLIIQPLLAFAGAHYFGTPDFESSVLVIEAGMPSGTIAAVVGARYGLDGGLASAITIATYIISLITMPLIFLLTS